MKRIAVWGWWQGKNLGDNWIKKTIHKLLPYAEFVDTKVQKFEGFDFVICGGGGLFIYDVISPWKQYDQKIPFGMLGLGAEFPHSSSIAQQLSERAEFFLVRDQYSLECMNINNIERSYDITFSIPLKWVPEEELSTKDVFLVWREGTELLENNKFNEYIQYNKVKDKWREVLNKNFDTVWEDDFQTEDDNIEDRINGKGFVISGRYHGIVAAIQKGIPFIAIDICPKIRALTRDCGLEEYCIKISEVGKLQCLIERANLNLADIREKEYQYRKEAEKKLNNQISVMEECIMRAIKPLKILHYGSYWMKENDVVNTMSDDLTELSNVIKIDLNIYGMKMDSRVKTKISTPNGCICILDTEKLIEDMRQFKPDCIILNSGGITMEDGAFLYAKSAGIKVVGISLSDPDVFPYNGQVYGYKCDRFYTNSVYSLNKQYNFMKQKIDLLPFAASPSHHYFMPEVKKKYDVVIVGHARKERMETVNRLSLKYRIGTYGNGWKDSLGVVNGIEHVKAINSGKMYLSFAATMAGYENVKVGIFEAVACRQVVITSYMEELEQYFEIGKEILCYKSLEELEDLIDYYILHEEEREQIRERAYCRYLSEHTYFKRWQKVIRDIWKTEKAE